MKTAQETASLIKISTSTQHGEDLVKSHTRDALIALRDYVEKNYHVEIKIDLERFVR